MSATKSTLPKQATVTGALGIASKTVTNVYAYQHGVVTVVEIMDSNSVAYYIKVKQGVVEIGGTAEFDTGTKILS